MKTPRKGVYKGKRNSNPKGKSEKTESNLVAMQSGERKKDAYSCAPNDWRWYAANEQLLKDAASYSYAYPLGNIMDYGQYGADANRQSIPGIMSIMWAPTFGYSDNMNSPINVAARSVFTIVRRANSGARNYDPIDLMIYLCASDSAYFMLEHFKRMYGVCNTYSQTNKFYPRAIVKALGGNFDDLQANLADFRAFLNVCAVKLNSLAVPATMSYMAKHAWLNKHLFLDSNVQKAQTYAFVPHNYFYFTLDSDSAGMLKRATTNGYFGTGVTLSTIKTIMNQIIDPLITNEDFGTMSGDILKAYGEGNCIRVEGISDTYTVIPTYEETALDQIQNCTMVGRLHTSNDCDLRQDPTKQYLVFKPEFEIARDDASADGQYPGRNAYFTRRIITFPHDKVEPKDTMEATRLTNMASSYRTSGLNDYFTYKTIGSEVVTEARVWIFSKASGTVQLHMHTPITTSIPYVVDITGAMDSTKLAQLINMFSGINTQLSDLMKFNRHMPVAVTAGIKATVPDGGGGTTDEWIFDGFNGYAYDINYYTMVDAQDLEQMSEIALMSEFDIVQFGTKDVM